MPYCALEQVATILDGKPVVAPLKDIQEVRNAIRAYDRFLQWNPARERDLLAAHAILMTGLLDVVGHYRTGEVAVMEVGIGWSNGKYRDQNQGKQVVTAFIQAGFQGI